MTAGSTSYKHLATEGSKLTRWCSSRRDEGVAICVVSLEAGEFSTRARYLDTLAVTTEEAILSYNDLVCNLLIYTSFQRTNAVSSGNFHRSARF